ncbi:hypothetical protein [Dankookia sp. P2]|uniref:hypothetical protein n=1 Tax=Dankookia sp. P2 TaxID=3423955 RepID=UPI003D678C00
MTLMMDALITAGRRLAEALRAENEALAALDLPRAAGLSTVKLRATDAFAAAYAAAAKTGTRAEGIARQDAAEPDGQAAEPGRGEPPPVAAGHRHPVAGDRDDRRGGPAAGRGARAMAPRAGPPRCGMPRPWP